MGCSKKFRKIHIRKHLCQSLFSNQVAGLRPATILKKRLWHRCFLVNFAKFLRTPFIKEHLWWLLLLVDWCLYDGIITNQHLLKVNYGNTRKMCKIWSVNNKDTRTRSLGLFCILYLLLIFNRFLT